MIAHIDADSFFASVLMRKHPHLRGKPLLALGMGGGCVIAASYEAKAKGVRTGMRVVDALKLCPEALRMPSDFHETAIASRQIEEILGNYCPHLEQMSIDEWFLDLRTLVGGIPQKRMQWGLDIRDVILRKTAMSVSVGIGSTKLLAKMASEYRKPAGVTVIGEGLDLKTFLSDRPAAAIPGIGRKRMQVTDQRGWKTAWDIAMAPTEELKMLFGKQGPELQDELLEKLVTKIAIESPPPKSVSRARSFRKESNRDLLWAHLLRHAEYVVLKMRRENLGCTGISLWLRDDTYEGWNGEQKRLSKATNTEEELQPYLHDLFSRLWKPEKKYTQIGLALWGLVPNGPEQASLFEDMQTLEKRSALQESLDRLHERYGRNSITRGAALSVSSGTTPRCEFSQYE